MEKSPRSLQRDLEKKQGKVWIDIPVENSRPESSGLRFGGKYVTAEEAKKYEARRAKKNINGSKNNK